MGSSVDRGSVYDERPPHGGTSCHRCAIVACDLLAGFCVDCVRVRLRLVKLVPLSVVLKKRGYLAAIAGDRQISTPAA